jgi:endonuclease/exonuclease/phosphatase family metal-dependent hydrolase
MGAVCMTMALAGCGASDRAPGEVGLVDAPDTHARDSDLAGEDAAPPAPDSALRMRVVTFNTGTASEARIGSDAPAGWGPEQAAWSDEHYGNGLAWRALIDDVRAWLARVEADVVVVQEMFHPGRCPDIPLEAHAGFVCEGWQPGDPTVFQQVLGEGWQVICHPGRDDKCLAVRTAFGRFAGCEADFCLEGAEGERVPGCGSGARVARGVVVRPAGTSITLTHVHGSSGLLPADQACRLAHFDQAFARPSDLVLGDFNTDPARFSPGDPSAVRLREAGTTGGWRFLNRWAEDALPTYGGVVTIDHVLGQGWEGTCHAAGLEAPWPAPTEARFFDHAPLVCDLVRLPR